VAAASFGAIWEVVMHEIEGQKIYDEIIKADSICSEQQVGVQVPPMAHTAS